MFPGRIDSIGEGRKKVHQEEEGQSQYYKKYTLLIYFTEYIFEVVLMW